MVGWKTQKAGIILPSLNFQPFFSVVTSTVPVQKPLKN